MADSVDRHSFSGRKNPGFRRSWCCSFTPPRSPDDLSSSSINPSNTSKPNPNPNLNSFLPSSSSTKLGLGLGRCILSPGRVSPIDSEATLDILTESVPEPEPEPEPESAPTPPRSPIGRSCSMALMVASAPIVACSQRDLNLDLDMRLEVNGKDGRVLSLELDSEVLQSKSTVFAEKIMEARQSGCRSIEVFDVGHLEAFKETIELMYEEDLLKRLIKIGVSQAIDILEVSSNIMFDMGVKSCLTYLEAVPWCENEEEKLKSLFTRCTFDKAVAQDVLARLNMQDPLSQPLGLHLVQCITQGIDINAKRVLKGLVKGLLSTSSVYHKDLAGINKAALYRICESSLHVLKSCFKDASGQVSVHQAATRRTRTLIGKISEQVDNLNWLLEILVERQMGEDFVSLWANQSELLRMHEKASPMVRYELSRISAFVFIALGRRKLQCRGGERYAVLQAWFGPMLVDFGWLQRCSKGLDVRELEEAMGHAVLTLPLKQQQCFFMEWLGCYSRRGTECPNLSKAFQIWWRRTFSRTAGAQL